MKVPFTILACFIVLVAEAQKSETMERVNAIPFPKNGVLILKFENTASEKFQCQLAPLEPLQGLPKYFSFRRKNTNLEFRAQFVNPLKYKLSMKSRYNDDPNIKIESEYFSTGVGSLPPQVTGLAPAPGGVPGLSFSVLIPDWFDLLQTQTGYAAGSTATLLKKLEPLEDFIAGEFQIGSTSNDFQSHLTNSINALAAATDGTTFLSKKTDADEVRKFIEDFKTNLNAMVTEVSNEMKRVPGVTYSTIFTETTKKAIKRLELEVDEFTRARFIIFENYKILLDEIDKVSITGDIINLAVPNVKFQSQKDLILTVTAIPITIDKERFTTKEGEKIEVEFYVIAKRPQVEASAGIAWASNSIVFNSYSAIQDSTSHRVSNTETIKSFLPVLFLNYYTRNTDGDNNTNEHMWILPQIGIGTGKEYPTVLIGAGYVIPSKFIISGGLLNAFTQKLNSGYSLNGKITETEANDLTTIYNFEWVPRFYLSLQFKF